MPNGAAVTLSFLVFCLLERSLEKKKKSQKKFPTITSQQLAAEDLDFYNAAPRKRQGVYYLIQLELKDPLNYGL